MQDSCGPTNLPPETQTLASEIERREQDAAQEVRTALPPLGHVRTHTALAVWLDDVGSVLESLARDAKQLPRIESPEKRVLAQTRLMGRLQRIVNIASNIAGISATLHCEEPPLVLLGPGGDFTSAINSH